MSYLFRYYAKVYDRFMAKFHLDDNATVCTRDLLESGEIYDIAKYAKSLGIDEMRIMEPIPCGSMQEFPQEVLTKEEQKKLISIHVQMNENKIYPKVSVFPYIESEDQYGCGVGSLAVYLK